MLGLGAGKAMELVQNEGYAYASKCCRYGTRLRGNCIESISEGITKDISKGISESISESTFESVSKSTFKGTFSAAKRECQQHQE